MKTAMQTLASLLLLLPVLALAGCDPHQDPIDKPGTWSLPPSGLTANDENLRTMLVNPNDLVNGSGTDTSDASEAAAPVDRLLSGRRYPLPMTSTSTEFSVPQSTQSGGTGGGGGAGTQQ